MGTITLTKIIPRSIGPVKKTADILADLAHGCFIVGF